MGANDPTVVNGRLMRTSPTAIETLFRCETAWWLRYVGKVEERVRQAIKNAQNIGTGAHKELELFIIDGKPPNDLLAKALLQYAPPRGKDVVVEGHTDPVLTCAGVPVTGRIDWTHGRLPKRPIVADWKTRSDLHKYQKTSDELRKDVQMNCYAKWAWLFYPNAESVDVAHYYVETKHHKDPDGNVRCMRCFPPSATCNNPDHAPKTDKVVVNFGVDDTAKVWSTIEQAVERMKVVAALKTAEEAGHPTDFVSRNSPCNAFGGCGYKYCCPHSPFRQEAIGANRAAFEGEANMSSALSALLNKRRLEQSATAVTPPPAPDAPAQTVAEAQPDVVLSAEVPQAGGILPPDVPVTTAPKAEVVESVKEDIKAQAAKPVQAERVEHAHTYDEATRQCACGAKKRGRKPASAEPTPEPEAEQEAVATQAFVTAPAAESNVVVAKQLLINAHSSASNVTDLTGYVAAKTMELAEKVLGSGRTDPRFVEKNSPLAYGGWRGALAEHVKSNPPEGSRWMLWTKGDEFAEVVATALAYLPGVEVIRGN